MFLLVLLAPFAAGCGDDGFNPYGEPEEGFGVFGFLDARTDRQVLRVEPIRRTPGLEELEDPPAVTLHDLTVGTTLALSDSLGLLSDSTAGLFYTARLRPEAGHTYRLEVMGDGVTTTAQTTLPEAPVLDPARPTITSDEPPRVVTQELRWNGLGRVPEDLAFFLRLRLGQTDTTLVLERSATYNATVEHGTYAYRTDLDNLFRTARQQLGIDSADTTSLRLVSLSAAFSLRSEGWNQPGGIQNGFGFFGHVSCYRVTWTLPADAVAALGLRDEQGAD